MGLKKNDYVWNHRVVRYPKSMGGGLAIHEAHYEVTPEQRKSRLPMHLQEIDPMLLTVDAKGVYGTDVKELREVLVQMLKATDIPVLNYRKFVKGTKKK